MRKKLCSPQRSDAEASGNFGMSEAKDLEQFLEILGRQPTSSVEASQALTEMFLSVKAQSGKCNQDNLPYIPVDLETVRVPCYVVSIDGRVVLSNRLAKMDFGINTGDLIDELDVEFAHTNEYSSQDGEVFRISKGFQKSKKRFILAANKKWHSAELPNAAKIVFLLVDRCGQAAVEKFQSDFGLTDGENKVLSAFVNGSSLQEIAEETQRSVLTVRRQFYAAMDKCSYSSQQELLIDIFGLQSFSEAIDPLVEQLRHPFRKKLVIPRPYGRTLDVVMAGDHSGKPIVFVTLFAHRAFSPEVEAYARQNGLLLLSVDRPGFGNSSMQPECTEKLKCYAQDIEALLDLFGRDQAVLLSLGTSFAASIIVANHIPHRISSLATTLPRLPRQTYLQAKKSNGWSSCISSPIYEKPHLNFFFAKQLLEAYRKFGAAKINNMILSRDSDALAAANRPEILADSQAAINSAFRQGVSPALDDFFYGHSDFGCDLQNLNKKIYCLAGRNDHIFTPETQSALQKSHPKVVLKAMELAGCSVHVTHPAEYVSFLVSAANDLDEIDLSPDLSALERGFSQAVSG